MLISLGLLVRTSMKMKIKRIEGLISRIEELEDQITQLGGAHTPVSTDKEKVY
jgi:hypothetical protein